MRSYEQAIFDFIKEHERVSRKEILHEFQHLSPKTVYSNVNRLLRAERIEEERHSGLLVRSRKDIAESRDSWPIHPVLSKFQNKTEITNAFVMQSPEFKARCRKYAEQYGTEMTLLFNDLMIILATLQGVDTWKAYEEHHEVNEPLLELELGRLEYVLKHFLSVDVKA